MWDLHMHSNFSGDCDVSMEKMAEMAVEKALDGICFTDHLDYDYREEPGLFDLDLDAHKRGLEEARNKFSGRLEILYGIELGLQPHLESRLRNVTETYPFDFVIGSSHVVRGVDPYYPAFYEGKSEKEAYREYFESILEILEKNFDFDVYGHLDYVVRYGPHKNLYYSYREYSDVIDEILKKIIEKGKGIEVNTGGFKAGLGHPNPTEDILLRYRELGGEIITTGADAHTPEYVAYEFDKIKEILKNTGFKYYTIFRKRSPEFLKL